MKLYFILILLLCFCNTNAQRNFDYYDRMTRHADTLFSEGKYQEAANEYNTAIVLNKNLGKIGHRYNIACCYVHLSELDSAFSQLFYIVEKGKFSAYETISRDECFKKLHSSSERWVKLLNLVLQNRKDKMEKMSGKKSE